MVLGGFVACASDGDKLSRLEEDVRSAEALVSYYEVTPSELMRRDTIAAKDMTRVRVWFDAIQEDSLPQAKKQLQLAERDLNAFMRR